MKHLTAIVLLLCALCMCGCGEKKPVVDTQNVSRILCCGLPDAVDGIELPQEDMAEIIAWLDGFEVGSRIDDRGLPPGSNSYWVILEYGNGRSVSVMPDSVEYDGETYHIEREPLPDCFHEVFGGE